jgi:hypothetical protein
LSLVKFVNSALEDDAKKCIETYNKTRYPNTTNKLILSFAKRRKKRDILEELKRDKEKEIMKQRTEKKQEAKKKKIPLEQLFRLIVRNVPWKASYFTSKCSLFKLIHLTVKCFYHPILNSFHCTF